MMSLLPLVPVIAAGLVPLIVGAAWYHPALFGTTWMSMKRVTPEMAERSSRLLLHSTAVMIALGIVTSFLLSHVLYGLGVETSAHAAVLACGLWFGIVIPATINRVLWDHIPLALYGIETGQWLVSLVLMSVILVY